jgi:methylglutaconyl-CoA hydratase
MASTVRVANASGYWGGDPTALAEAKKLIRDLATADRAAVPALTADLIARLRAGAEGQEGMAAFLDKRPPRRTS